MPSHQFTSFPELGPVVLLELRRLTTYVPLWFLNLVAAGIYSASFPIRRGADQASLTQDHGDEMRMMLSSNVLAYAASGFKAEAQKSFE